MDVEVISADEHVFSYLEQVVVMFTCQELQYFGVKKTRSNKLYFERINWSGSISESDEMGQPSWT